MKKQQAIVISVTLDRACKEGIVLMLMKSRALLTGSDLPALLSELPATHVANATVAAIENLILVMSRSVCYEVSCGMCRQLLLLEGQLKS